MMNNNNDEDFGSRVWSSNYRGRSYGGRGKKPRGGYNRSNPSYGGNYDHGRRNHFNTNRNGRNDTYNWRPLNRKVNDDNLREGLVKLGFTKDQIESVLKLSGNQNTSNEGRSQAGKSNASFALSQFAKLFNHKQNWITLPRTLQRGLENFIQNIHLPLMDEWVSDALDKAVSGFGDKLCLIVQTHLIQHSERLISDLRLLSDDVLLASKRKAEQYLQLDISVIHEAWKSLDLDLIGYRMAPPLRVAPLVQVANMEVETSGPSTLLIDPTLSLIGTSVNKKRPQLSPDQTENKRLHRHSDIDDVESSPASIVQVDNSPVNKFRKNIVRHPSGDRDAWRITHVPISCNTLVVGDSNLVNWQPHERVSIQSFPGACVKDISKILLEYTPKAHLKRLVLAVGVNNHLCSKVTNEADMKELISIATEWDNCVKSAVEIAVSPKHEVVSIGTINEMNFKLKSTFLQNLITWESINPGFVDQQHYDTASAHAMSLKCYNFLSII